MRQRIAEVEAWVARHLLDPSWFCGPEPSPLPPALDWYGAFSGQTSKDPTEANAAIARGHGLTRDRLEQVVTARRRLVTATGDSSPQGRLLWSSPEWTLSWQFGWGSRPDLFDRDDIVRRDFWVHYQAVPPHRAWQDDRDERGIVSWIPQRLVTEFAPYVEILDQLDGSVFWMREDQLL